MGKYVYHLTKVGKEKKVHSISHEGKQYVFDKNGVIEVNSPIAHPEAHFLKLGDVKGTESLDEMAKKAKIAQAEEESKKAEAAFQDFLLKNPAKKKTYEEALKEKMTEDEARELAGYKA